MKTGLPVKTAEVAATNKSIRRATGEIKSIIATSAIRLALRYTFRL
jgi:hypothetical protein